MARSTRSKEVKDWIVFTIGCVGLVLYPMIVTFGSYPFREVIFLGFLAMAGVGLFQRLDR